MWILPPPANVPVPSSTPGGQGQPSHMQTATRLPHTNNGGGGDGNDGDGDGDDNEDLPMAYQGHTPRSPAKNTFSVSGSH